MSRGYHAGDHMFFVFDSECKKIIGYNGHLKVYHSRKNADRYAGHYGEIIEYAPIKYGRNATQMNLLLNQKMITQGHSGRLMRTAFGDQTAIGLSAKRSLKAFQQTGWVKYTGNTAVIQFIATRNTLLLQRNLIRTVGFLLRL